MKNAITDNECDTACRGRKGGSRCGAHYFDVMALNENWAQHNSMKCWVQKNRNNEITLKWFYCVEDTWEYHATKIFRDPKFMSGESYRTNQPILGLILWSQIHHATKIFHDPKFMSGESYRTDQPILGLVLRSQIHHATKNLCAPKFISGESYRNELPISLSILQKQNITLRKACAFLSSFLAKATAVRVKSDVGNWIKTSYNEEIEIKRRMP